MRRRVCLKSPVRENRTPGSVRGKGGNPLPYRDDQPTEKRKRENAQQRHVTEQIDGRHRPRREAGAVNV